MLSVSFTSQETYSVLTGLWSSSSNYEAYTGSLVTVKFLYYDLLMFEYLHCCELSSYIMNIIILLI